MKGTLIPTRQRKVSGQRRRRKNERGEGLTRTANVERSVPNLRTGSQMRFSTVEYMKPASLSGNFGNHFTHYGMDAH